MGCCKAADVDFKQWMNYFLNHVHEYDSDYSKDLANFLDSRETRNRYYFYLNRKYSVSNFRFSLVERFQSTYKRHSSEPNNYLRSKLTIGYTIKKLKLDRIRFSGGLNYKINGKNTLQFYYRYHVFKRFDPVNYLHALGIVYKLQL